MIAALSDLDVSHVLGREAEAWRVVIGNVLRLAGDEVFLLVILGADEALNDRGDLGDLIETDECIHLRH